MLNKIIIGVVSGLIVVAILQAAKQVKSDGVDSATDTL